MLLPVECDENHTWSSSEIDDSHFNMPTLTPDNCHSSSALLGFHFQPKNAE